MNKSWRGSGIILYYKKDNETFVLIGKETKYLSDYLTDLSLNAINDKINLDQAKHIFSERAKQLSITDVLNDNILRNVTYDTPLFENNCWNTNMRIIPIEDFNYGIPKGGKKDNDDNPIKTALREFKEEIANIELNEELLKFITIERGYHFYSYEIDKENVIKIKKKIKKYIIKHFGELQEIQFMELKKIKNNLNTFNGLTRKIFKDFFIELN
jgi:hypothetical protein